MAPLRSKRLSKQKRFSSQKGAVMTETDERERDAWTPRRPLTKEEKLERIREMKAELRGEPEKGNNQCA